MTTMRSGHIVKIIPIDVDTYKTIRKGFTERNISHYTYRLKHERAYRAVIRGLHHSAEKDLIKSELKNHSHEVRIVTNLLHRLIKEPLFYVDLEPKPNNKDIFNVRAINNTVVTIEPPRIKKDVVQCKRC